MDVDKSFEILELDELYWFINRKPRTKTHENVYIMTMVSRSPRQIVGFDVVFDKSPDRIQAMVDSCVSVDKYCTDGYLGYVDIAYPGKHVRNTLDKSDTFTVEGINADLRHYELRPMSRQLRENNKLSPFSVIHKIAVPAVAVVAV